MYAVLSGDIVSSTKLTPDELDAAIEAIKEASALIGNWPSVSTIGFARRAGDAWQLAFDATHFSLRAALFLQASVRRLDKDMLSRIAIAVGRGNMPDRDPNKAHGDAFVASGRLLDSFPSSVFVVDAAGGARNAAAILASHIAQNWTQAQARAMAIQLCPDAGARTETAKQLKITRQAVNQALWSAGFLAIETALESLETQRAS